MNGTVAVGIDLGTTYSVIARLDERGRSVIVRNAQGDLLTPSVVFFDDDEIVVGKAAKKVAGLEPHRVAECAKRDIGSQHFSHPINGKQVPPEAIEACILRKLKDDAAAVVGQDFKVVVTVPAYFDEPRRKATSDAGEMAGLDVLDIVNEPTAAALAFGEQLGYLTTSGDPKQPMKVMVYDLGGGTFDVTIIDLAKGDIRTLATDGDVQLGGRDWDQLLADHVAQVFQRRNSVDILADPSAAARLMRLVEEAKHTLSSRDHAVVHIEHQGKTAEVRISRAEFEEMSQGLLERTAFTTRQVLSATGLSWRDISRVLLVGGSTRMPMVPSMIQRLSGIAPDRSINPDEAVARGAALFAAYQMARQKGPAQAAFQVTDVCAHSLGIQGIDQSSLRRENVVVIPRNTPLPANVMKPFVTQSAGQKSIVVQVLEGESSQPEMCSRIGRSVLRGMPASLTKGHPVHINFSYNTAARLYVEAEIPGTTHKVSIELERDKGLSNAQIGRWRQLFDDAGGGSVDELLAEALRVPSGTATENMTPVTGQPAKPATPSPAGSSIPTATAIPTSPATAPTPTATPAPAATNAAGAGINPPTSPVAAKASAAATAAGPGTSPGSPIPAAADVSTELANERRQRLIRRLIHVCGHVVSMIIGLAAGYYILCWLRPEADFLGLFSR